MHTLSTKIKGSFLDYTRKRIKEFKTEREYLVGGNQVKMEDC